MEINKIYNEDNLITLKRIDDNSVNMVITSPPYSDLRTYNGVFKYDFKLLATELIRVLKPGGIIVWVEGDKVKNFDKSGRSFAHALYFKKLGLKLYDVIIYEKSGFAFPNEKRYNNIFEYMFILSKGIPKTINLLRDRENSYFGKKISGSERQKDGSVTKKIGVDKGRIVKEFGVRNNIWKYNTGWLHSYKEEYLKQHPAIFPEKLAEDHILSWTNEKGLVLDPFMGSGTLAKMCILNNRNFIGSEICKEYYELAIKRINEIQKSN